MSIATLGQLLASDTVHCGSSARSSEKTTSLVVHTLFSLIPARFKISVDSASRQVQTRASEYTYPTSIRGSIRFKLSAPMHTTSGFFPETQFINRNRELQPTGHPSEVPSTIWPPPTIRRALRRIRRDTGMGPDTTSICHASYWAFTSSVTPCGTNTYCLAEGSSLRNCRESAHKMASSPKLCPP